MLAPAMPNDTSHSTATHRLVLVIRVNTFERIAKAST